MTCIFCLRFRNPLPFFVKCVTKKTSGHCTNISPAKKFDTKSRYLEMFAFRFLCLLIQSEDRGDMGCCSVDAREKEHEEDSNETRDVVVWIV